MAVNPHSASPPDTLDTMRKDLAALSGTDCYAEKALFPNGPDDLEALKWVTEALHRIVHKKGANAAKAQRTIEILTRIIAYGYRDHIMAHKGAALIEECQQLRETVNHLSSLLLKEQGNPDIVGFALLTKDDAKTLLQDVLKES